MANPTTNYGFVLPSPTDLVTDLPADFDVALQGVDTRLKALQPGTTLGDLAYSSATANTNTRLAIGSSGQVLGVSAGAPAWVNAPSPTSAQSFVSTAQSTTSSTYAALGTAQAVTLTTGTKVLVLLSMSATSDNSTNNPRSFMSVAVSGATTTAASDANSVMSRCVQANVLNGRVGVSLFLTCTAGSNTFTAQFRQPDFTGTFSDRQMIVIDLGS